jgi:hypothetical protein
MRFMVFDRISLLQPSIEEAMLSAAERLKWHFQLLNSPCQWSFGVVVAVLRSLPSSEPMLRLHPIGATESRPQSHSHKALNETKIHIATGSKP